MFLNRRVCRDRLLWGEDLTKYFLRHTPKGSLMGGRCREKEIAFAFWKERSLRKKPIRGGFHFQSLHFQNLYESFENARVGAKSLLPKKGTALF